MHILTLKMASWLIIEEPQKRRSGAAHTAEAVLHCDTRNLKCMNALPSGPGES